MIRTNYGKLAEVKTMKSSIYDTVAGIVDLAAAITYEEIYYVSVINK